MTLLDQSQVTALYETHPEGAYLLDSRKRFDFFLRPPTSSEYKRWRQAVSAGGTMAAVATENLMRMCCVHPDRLGVDAMLDRFPGAFDSSGAQDAVKKLLGLETEEQGKG